MTSLQQQARALGDPTRHEIFRLIAASERGLGVAELTERLGLNHNAIRQHLAKLVDAGLVVESRVATGGRGRPRLLYEVDLAADSRWGPVGPYERLSVLLAEIISTGDSAVEVGRRAATQFPVRNGSPSETLQDVAKVMARLGFEPELRERGRRADIVLGRCPFVTTVLADREVVCALHLGMAEGLAGANPQVVVDELVAKDPRKAQCRLRLHVDPEGEASSATGRTG